MLSMDAMIGWCYCSLFFSSISPSSVSTFIVSSTSAAVAASSTLYHRHRQ